MGKFGGGNEKAIAARERKKDQQEQKNAEEQKRKEDALWRDDDKTKAAKDARARAKEEAHDAKLEKDKEKRELLQAEEEALKNVGKSKKQLAGSKKVSRRDIQSHALMGLSAPPTKKKSHKPAAAAPKVVTDVPLQENINHLIRAQAEKGVEVVSASGIDKAIGALASEGDVGEDRHPEKRVKALYAAFEERRMAEMKEEYPNLKRSQYKDKIFKEWQKSPENPLRDLKKGGDVPTLKESFLYMGGVCCGASSSSSLTKEPASMDRSDGRRDSSQLAVAGSPVREVSSAVGTSALAGGGSIPAEDVSLRMLVDKDPFEEPVSPIHQSGGTAAFYRVKYRPNCGDGRSPEYWIGKDLSRAADEVDFYDEINALRKLENASELKAQSWAISDYMLEYAGVCRLRVKCPIKSPGRAISDGSGTSQTSGGEVIEERDLILMRNLYDGYKSLRLLDIKMGEVTAVAGWQGKSRFRAWRGHRIDKHTNSQVEGFRLEGFDGAPWCLESMDPSAALKMYKSQARRLQYQRLSAQDFLTYFLDMRQAYSSDGPLCEERSPEEYVELVLLQILQKLCKICSALSEVNVPQMWVGSSIALGFDADGFSALGTPKTQVVLFDWGRSELNTSTKNSKLSQEEQHRRTKYWGHYLCAAHRLFYETARVYYNRYLAVEWRSVVFEVWDYDSITENDFVGRVAIPVEMSKLSAETYTNYVLYLLDCEDEKTLTRNSRGDASLLYVSLKKIEYSEGSRFKEGLLVRVEQARNLPIKDYIGSCDAAVTVGVTDLPIENPSRMPQCVKDERRSGKSPRDAIGFSFPLLGSAASASNCQCLQQTSVITDSLDPVWGGPKGLGEVFEFAVTKVDDVTGKDFLEAITGGEISTFDRSFCNGLFPISGGDIETGDAYQDFVRNFVPTTCGDISSPSVH
ncbi:hypothetical protein FOL47_007727 [Perkinsus chesapeaki]|uniref:C2 domain-containing protein n=1 Tax=Perkinsus chesapeaki TaxID=330153 RepID=A0A7J6LIF2_PERCH|nr:hypothetical protein FOL47_007727 [Perkinsus chesapeaki]